MGYRSNLMALIYPDACASEEQMLEKYEQLKVLMGTTFKEVVDEYFGSCMTWMEEECVLKFDISDVKWYPSYPDVQMFEKMVEAFDGDVPGYCTEFVRVGEETEDVEERHAGDNNQYYLSVRRLIDCNI